MSRAYQRSQEIRTRLNAGDGVSSAEKMKLGAELALQELQLANLQQQLDNRTSMQDLAVKQRDYQSARLASEEQKLQLLQEQSSAKRLGDTEKTAEQTGELVAADDNPLVQKSRSSTISSASSWSAPPPTSTRWYRRTCRPRAGWSAAPRPSATSTNRCRCSRATCCCHVFSTSSINSWSRRLPRW